MTSSEGRTRIGNWTLVPANMATGAEEPFWQHDQGYSFDASGKSPTYETSVMYDEEDLEVGTVWRTKKGWTHSKIPADKAISFSTVFKAADDLIRKHEDAMSSRVVDDLTIEDALDDLAKGVGHDGTLLSKS